MHTFLISIIINTHRQLACVFFLFIQGEMDMFELGYGEKYYLHDNEVTVEYDGFETLITHDYEREWVKIED